MSENAVQAGEAQTILTRWLGDDVQPVPTMLFLVLRRCGACEEQKKDLKVLKAKYGKDLPFRCMEIEHGVLQELLQLLRAQKSTAPRLLQQLTRHLEGVHSFPKLVRFFPGEGFTASTGMVPGRQLCDLIAGSHRGLQCASHFT